MAKLKKQQTGIDQEKILAIGQSSVELIKSSKGDYSWGIKSYNPDIKKALKEAIEVDLKLKRKYKTKE